MYNFLKNISYIGICFSFILCLSCLGLLISAIRKKFRYTLLDYYNDSRVGNSSKSNFIYLAILILSLTLNLSLNPTIHEIFGIYNLEILPCGTYCFYVDIFSVKGNLLQHQYGKTYTLPAKVTIEDIYLGDGKVYREYYLDSVYFSNGGYLYFDSLVNLNSSEYIEDQNGQHWQCKLLNKHAYSPYIAETTSLDSEEKNFLIFIVSIHSIPIMVLFIEIMQTLKRNQKFFC